MRKKGSGVNMSKIERYEASIPVEDYMKGYVDVETFLGYCKQCQNYGKIWACPSYDFDVEEYWRQYKTLDLLAVKIFTEESLREKEYTGKEMQEVTQQILLPEKQKLSDELMKKEKEIPGSICLAAGSCTLCQGNCTRKENKPCRYPDKMRYSIESLGGNVGLTISKLMGIELEWITEGKMPSYFVLVSGLLKK